MADDIKILQETKKLQDEILDQINEMGKRKRESLDALSKENEALEEMKSKLRDQITLLLERSRKEGANTEQLKEQISLLREKEKHIDSQLSDMKEMNILLEKQGKSMSLALKTMTGITDQWKDTFIGSFLVATHEAANLSIALEVASKQIKEQLSISNALGSGLMKMQEATIALAVAQDQAISSFMKNTGAAYEYRNIIVDLERSNLRFGMSNQDVANSLEALYTNMNTFTSLSKVQQQEITETVAQLEKLGISADTSARNITIATRALGMSVDESERLTRELYTAATALQLPPSMVAEGFAKAAPQLAAHGDKMISVFKGLAKQSKETGVAIESLLGITKQFDTFEGSAQAAGKLNTLLGGDYLNSVELLTASEEERIKLMQDAIDMSGVQWHEMNKFQKMAIANSLGITDMAEAAMLFNPQMIGMSEADKKTAASKKELADRMKEVLPLAEQMKSVMAAFAISMTPLVEKLKWLADGVLKLNDKLGGWLVPGVLGALAVVKMLSVGITTLTPIVGLFGKSAEKAGESAGKGLANGIEKVGEAASKTKGGLLQLGAAALMVGAGIGLAALGMAQFVLAFNGMDASQILSVSVAILAFGAAVVGIVLALAAVGPAGAIAIGILVALGAAFFVMAQSVKIINDSLTNVTDAVVERYRAIGAEIKGIVQAVNELSLAKAVPFTVITSTVADSTSRIDGAGTAKAKAQNSALAALAGQGGGETKVEVVPAKLIVDGKVLAEIVSPITQKQAGKILDKVGGRGSRVPGRLEFENS